MTAPGPRNTGDLFANHRDVNLASTIAMIEDLLVEHGYFLNDCRADLAGTVRSWRVTHGSATVRISLLERPDFPRLRVASSVIRPTPDVDRIALYRHLLTLNATLCGAAFALAGDNVILCAERSTLDLDRSELSELVTRIQAYADDHDDALIAEFGGELGGDAANAAT